ncbi:2-succinyl-6-hydroxy-2,4-cyclohexadiene-1-carboxylate synthase [Haemophilus paracuniculus]|uniref:Putative 2-succinyl-6-hydroxy-2,4-cyclohexadiene-1-carboxylate synthase n=1 Tax=Haemophilus paracuniculus TaxID=734 RepID=A0A1T0ATK9_9PAST|nr:2-succinyl-6-hydroxy-2,4-cyclohexadiene-1-carboxylate synthase [Haemophilus paracuniculus]OOR99798.1 2-succinyl-6-hydroxy-2,4-cyclohexadiene-1-carboxylate synthase [Haemophilus paracuniculus]
MKTPNRPPLAVLFLHGLLGSKQDWADVFRHLQKFPQIQPLAIDLPFHGENVNQGCLDFAEARTWLDQQIHTLIGSCPFWLVGYSLGGRIALDYTLSQRNPNQLGAILEGANLGLNSEEERQARWQNDLHWANRFQNEPLEQVLNDWYQQPVFAHLTAEQRINLIAKRKHNQGDKIAQMLQATSLAKQPFFEPSKGADFEKFLHFVIGERDQKFRQQAEKYQLSHRLIPHAGHNSHQENPQGFVQTLLEILLNIESQ